MSISSTTRKAGPFAGNGIQTVFPFTFKLFLTSEVVVTRAVAGVETVLALGVDYTALLNADQEAAPGGSITLSAPLAIGATLAISSSVAALQQTTLTNGGGFFPSVINAVFDRLTILVQQIAEQIGRTFRIPITATGVTDFNVPVLAGGVLQWHADGTHLVAQALPDLSLSLALPSMAAHGGEYLTNNSVVASWGPITALSAAVNLTGVITPAQITANQNDYNPANLSTASVLRLSTDASRNVTGLAGGANGRLAILLNVGAQPLVLKNQDAGSTAANRFAFGVDRTLQAGRSIILLYDATQSRWLDMGPLSKALAATFLAGTDDERYLTTKAVFDANAFFALTDAATVVWDHNNGFNFTVTLGGNRTLGFPSNPKIQGGIVEVVQDGTGSRTLSYTAGIKRENGAPTLSTAAGSKDYLPYQMITTGLMIYSFIKAPS